MRKTGQKTKESTSLLNPIKLSIFSWAHVSAHFFSPTAPPGPLLALLLIAAHNSCSSPSPLLLCRYCCFSERYMSDYYQLGFEGVGEWIGMRV
ncbi:hypothetical protein TB2_002653 [Malus domestica]